MKTLAYIALLTFLAIFSWSAAFIVISAILSIFMHIPGDLVGLLGQGLIVGFFGTVISGAAMEL